MLVKTQVPALLSDFKDIGFRVWVLGSRVQALISDFKDAGFAVKGLGFVF